MADNMNWTQKEAIDICVKIESFCPKYKYHVGLTGGCLYQEGEREDLDLLFYKIRIEEPNRIKLITHLITSLDWSFIGHYGWVTKMIDNQDREIDLFFPDFKGEKEFIPKGNPKSHY